MNLSHALQTLRDIETHGSREMRETSRVVTVDGENFWVEWFGPYDYWEDYLHQIRSESDLEAAKEAAR